jgi:cyclase
MTNPIRRALLAAGALGAAACAIAPPAPTPPPAAPTGFEDVQIKTTDLGHGVYVLEGRGGNIGVSAGADGVVLIDDQFAPLTPKIEAALRAISDQPVRFVLNTHWHGDHTGGNEGLGKGGALIVAHHNVRKRLQAGGFMESFKTDVPPAPAAALPVVTFGEDASFHVNGLELAALHVAPAHTDGDAVVFFRGANVVHLGDLYFNGLYPVIDWGSGGHIDGMIAALDRLLPLIDEQTRVIPGHGPLSNKAELRAYRDLLATVATRIKKLMKQGKTLEQIKAAKPTAEYDELWGQKHFKADDWVEVVYRGLERAGAPPGRAKP